MNMRNAKRKIGLLLILCMFVSMLPASVWADGSGPLSTAPPPAAAAGAKTGPANQPAPSGSGGDYVEITQQQLASSTAADVAVPFSLPEGAFGSGTLQKGATYQFDEDTKVLTISGAGKIDDFNSPKDAPWESYSHWIKEVVIESGVTHIGKNAFHGFDALTSLTVPYDITADPAAFGDCDTITKVTVPDHWTFDSGALDISSNNALKTPLPWAVLKERITNINIADAVTTGITKDIFAGCTKLTDVVIKNKTAKIAEDAFKDCSALTHVEVTDTWKYADGELSILASEAVKAPVPWASLKDRVTKVVIATGVTGIEESTFDGMDKLTDDVAQRPPVVLFEGDANSWGAVGGACDKFGLKAGTGKYLIVSCKNGSLIGKCGETTSFAFDGIDTLTITGAKIDNYGTNTSGVIYEDGQSKAPWYSVRGRISKLNMPDITEIGAFAFYSCTKLESVAISDKVTSIGDYAFAKCEKLTALTIAPSGSDLSIGKYAFWDCKELKNLGSPWTSTTALTAGIPKRVKTIGEAAFRTSGLTYDKKNETGHVYYEGNKNEWRALNNQGQSPDIRDGKLLVGAKTGDESTYAIVHYMGAVDDELYYTLKFDGGLGSKNDAPELSDTDITSRIVTTALSTKTVDKETLQTVAVDTKFKLPGQGDLERPGFGFAGWLCSADNQIYLTDDEFTMPKKEVTFTAQWKLNVPDAGGEIEQFIEQFSDAKNTGRPNYFWNTTQATASSESELNKWLYDTVQARLDAVKANFPSITDVRFRIQIKSFTPAVMGISNMTAGQNGRFSFDVHFTLKNGGSVFTPTASVKDGVITAIEYDAGKTDIVYTVSFDPGGGQPSDAQEKPKTYYPGTSLLLPECKYGPPSQDQEFQGWKCKFDNVYKVMSDAEINLLEQLNYRENAKFTMRPANVTFIAQWKTIIPISNTITISPTSSVVTRQGAPQPTTVQNLDALISSDVVPGKSVSVTMEAAPVDPASPEAARLNAASVSDEMTFVDLTISKTVDGQTSAITDTQGTLVAVTLPFDGKNAENVKVYRDHEGQVDVLTGENHTGERIAVTNDSLTIYASKFSVYAIAFDHKTSTPDVTPPTPDVTPPTPGGTPGGGSNNGSSSSGSSTNGGSSKPSIRDDGTTKPSKPQSDTGSDTVPKSPFNDVPPGAWYYEAATWAYDAKIAKGEGGKRLNPNKLCTRAEMLTFLWRSLGCPDPVGTGKSFTDVPSGAYYTKAVQWAASLKIVKGEGGKRFNPDATVTRAEAITFLYRALGVPSAAVGRFTDVPASAYYAEAVEWAAEHDIAKGMGKRSFSPASPCTRAQVLTFLYRSQS